MSALRACLLFAATSALACTAPASRGDTRKGGAPEPLLTREPTAEASSARVDVGGGAGDPASARLDQSTSTPSVSATSAERTLFLGNVPAEAGACGKGSDEPQRVRCLLRVRFADDAVAQAAAIAMYDQSGSVVGLNPARTMDGGWRGMLELVPELPVGRHRRYLEWLRVAMRDFERFFALLEPAGGQQDAGASNAVRYRWRSLELRFFRSVGRTTPSAYADGWSVAFNVSGSLHGSADAVRETMFHEIFHLNDSDHGGWSAVHLAPLYDGVVARCTQGGRLVTSCLAPFAPGDTMVRGGTYYAFQPGNGVWEYAAELAIRYYREHRAVLSGQPLGRRAFKCGPEPNPTAWRLLAAEFFGAIDRVATCDPGSGRGAAAPP